MNTPEPHSVPETLRWLAEHARPTRVVDIDIEQPLPEIDPDERYSSAWVVARRGGIPRGATSVDLDGGPAAVREQLATLVARPDISGVRPWDAAPLEDSELPRISVVVPTIVARREDIARCIEQLGRLDYPDFEVLLVDNRRVPPADDFLPALVDGLPWLTVVHEPRPGISAARNAGVARATGSVVAFTDDDVRVEAGWLRALGTRIVRQPELDAVTGLILPAEMETPAQIWYERYYGGFSGERTFAPLTLQAESGGRWRRGSRVAVRDSAGETVRVFAVYGSGAFGAGANMAFRKQTLDRLGGFDLALGTGTPARGGEDLAVLIGVLWTGGVLGYEPGAVAHHRHRQGYSELVDQLEGNGLGFTAMLTSLILHDPRHLVGLASQLPLAVRRLVGQSTKRLRGGTRTPAAAGTSATAPQYPPVLVRRELGSYPRGPLAYARSRYSARAAQSNR